jgi:hypothetical protein
MIDINWKPSPRMLRQFAVAALFGFGLVGGLVAWKWDNLDVARWLWAAGAVICVLGLIAPRSVLPVYILLTAAAFPVGLVISHVILLIMFFGLFTPIALAFRLFGRDLLQRSIEPESASYWSLRSDPLPPRRYYNQY